MIPEEHSFAYLLGKCTEAVERLNETLEKMSTTQTDHADRISNLEQSRSWARGVIAAGMAACAVIGTCIGVLFK